MDEANSMIPRLEQVLTEVDLRMAAVQQAAERLQILDVLWGEKLGDPANPDHDEGEGHRLEITTLMSEVEQLVGSEIESRGLRFPVGGLEHGLIDFPTTWEDRWVLLCWRRGEPEIYAWHELDAGYAGRRVLLPEQVRHMGSWRPGRSRPGDYTDS